MKTLFGVLAIFLLLGMFAPKFNGWIRLLLIFVIAAMVAYISFT